MNKYASVKDFEKKAVSIMTENARSYINSGANHELCLRENEAKMGLVKLNPRVLRDVSKIDTSTTLIGRRLAIPFGIAPSAMHCLVDPQGELNTVRAAGECNTVMALSTLSTKSIQEVSEASESCFKWFQLYITKDRKITKTLIYLAEKHGYEALVVTVDAPVLGKREQDVRNKFNLPPGYRLENLETLSDLLKMDSSSGSGLFKLFSDQIAKNLSWSDIEWLRGQTSLPIVLKGIMSAQDARLCGKEKIQFFFNIFRFFYIFVNFL